MILMPTCNSHVAAAEASAVLLHRHWPDHPPLHVVHHEDCPAINGATFHAAGPQLSVSWLEAMCGAVRSIGMETFVLLLDDYAMYAPPAAGAVTRAIELVNRDATIGLFPLCRYPGFRDGEVAPGLSRLKLPCAILLQAAVWRADWFLHLADAVNPKCSPWGFESAATQAAKRHPRHVCVTTDAETTILPYHNLMHRGQWVPEHVRWLIHEGIDVPSRGLGDTLAKVIHATGLDRFAPENCGCGGRQEKLNAMVPFAQ